eukprot:TRINITY_DN4781_c0_g1_i2.p1 TRINITY_DN4781_c0_g1~~TRINITY_DN4781_c0_g1_i2.p1  ORF type:complete len:292 (+),score=29.66 TRINITY_DN4781_c0_g1_i2:122-997(+)
MEPFVIGYLRLLLLFFCSFNATSFEIGVTHTHDDVSEWSDPASADRAKRLLSNRVIRFQNQHIMGWGADNPQPAPGYYNWTSLDARIEMIRQTNGTGVLALCCAPDWMKGGQANTTDWSKIAVAPLAEHYKDFAALASRVAERYPDIAHFQVWNELKGFWNQSANRWAYDNYTTMYNLVHAAVKRVRPDAIIGGPYVPFGNLLPPGTPSPVMGPWGSINPNSLDAVAYWLEHKVAADFVCVDGHAAFNQTTGDPESSFPLMCSSTYRVVSQCHEQSYFVSIAQANITRALH